MRFQTADEIQQGDSERLKELVVFFEKFLGQKHLKLGREGVVCPYIRPAMEKNKLKILLVEDTLEELVDSFPLHLELLLKEFLAFNNDVDDLNSLIILFQGLEGTTKFMFTIDERLMTMNKALNDFRLQVADLGLMIPMLKSDNLFINPESSLFPYYQKKFKGN
jgi:hypothetical protein